MKQFEIKQVYRKDNSLYIHLFNFYGSFHPIITLPAFNDNAVEYFQNMIGHSYEIDKIIMLAEIVSKK